jgi:ceramide glucosyltransferase
MLFQRSAAQRFGGLRVLGRYLAEDFVAGEAMQRLGLKVVLSVDPVPQIIGKYSFNTFWNRHLRWGRIRKKHGLLAFNLELWCGSLVSGLLGAASMNQLLGAPMASFLIFHLATWSICDVLLMRTLGMPLKWSTPIYWFMREFLALPMWVHIASGNKISWRGHRLEILAGGVLESRA